tara:strand:+ start:743 stop:1012 length:270 start_codon:yes stop_codon:yes gene_type:complete
MTEKTFPEGINVKRPNEGAPDFVKAKIWIRRTEFIKWLASQSEDSVNLDLLASKGNKLYFSVDDWVPTGKGLPNTPPPPADDFDDDIPF